MSRRFNGSSDFINFGTITHGVGTGVFTWSFWVRPTSVSIIRTVFQNGDSGAVPAIYTTTDNTQWGLWFGGQWRRSGSSLSVNTWYHLLIRRVSGGNVFFHQDGSNLGSFNDAMSLPNATNRAGQNGAASGFFQGDIAEIACWNVDLDQREITALARGVRASRIRRSSMYLYAPLYAGQNPEPGYVARAQGTLTGTTVTRHPPIQLMSIISMASAPDVPDAPPPATRRIFVCMN